jgi:hypothetical protein
LKLDIKLKEATHHYQGLKRKRKTTAKRNENNTKKWREKKQLDNRYVN